MTSKIKFCISVSSFTIWLALSNQIASANGINHLLKEKDESYSGFKSDEKKNILIRKNLFREQLKEKFEHYVSDTDSQTTVEQDSAQPLLNVSQNNVRKGELIVNAINDLNTARLNDRDSKLSEQPEIKPSEKPSLIESKPLKVSDLNSDYISPPEIASPEKIHPFTTTFPLNGVPISHLTEWEFYTGTTFGDDNNTSISNGGIVKLNGQVTESLTKDNIYTVDQKGSYLQLQTVRETRKVELTRNEPHTMLGMQMQMSFTASCLTGENVDEKQCSYTPGLITDRNSIDPDFFVPTRIVQTANMNEVVTPESLAVMQLPGFQTGANGQQVGLDLYFPNAGAFPGNTQGNQVFYQRKENIQNTQIGLYSKVRQIVKANHNKAVIGRTIRGFGLVTDSDNLLLNSAVQLGNFVLPDVNPRLEGGTQKVNTNINKNLFLAANNVRIPTSSYTFYHAGIGSADSLKPDIKRISQIPRAKFNSVWVGISPVIDRKIEKITRYQPTGKQRILSDGGGEGGVDSNVSLVSIANGETFSTNDLKDFYAQIYLTNFVQDVNLVTGNRFVEDIKYYPHISLTGNILGSLDSLKYYTGVITGKTIKAYVGSDYTRNFGNLNVSTGAIGYINPDRDYYSQLYGSLSQKIGSSRRTNLVLSSSFNYALDRENRIGKIESEAPASLVTVGARANFGNVSLGVVNYFDDILPNSVEKTLLADLAINFSKNFRLTAYYTPINEASSRSRYGATAKLRLGGKYNSPTVSLSWTNNDYDLGKDSEGIKLRFTDNIFKVLFRLGAPGNPFNKVDNKHILRRNRKNLIDRLRR